MALKPGSEVALKVESTEDIDLKGMRRGLKQAVEQAGWKVNEQSATVVVASIQRGKKQTLYFRTLGRSLFAPADKVKMTPYTASVEIRRDSKVLWSRRSTNMVPSLIHLEEGQSLKQAVKQYEKPDPEFFERLSLPPKILKMEARSHVGRSQIRNGRWADF